MTYMEVAMEMVVNIERGTMLYLLILENPLNNNVVTGDEIDQVYVLKLQGKSSGLRARPVFWSN